MIELNRIYNMDCIEGMRLVDGNSIDLVVTSPPYDNIRTYGKGIDKTWCEDVWKKVILELYRIAKDGGAVIWVVGDATKDGSETGTSFRQVLWFMECGFKLYDTMIYQKQNYVPLTHRRYEQEFEYMFVFTKGKPKSFNPIMIPCKYAGTETWGERTFHKTNDSGLVACGKKKVNDFKQHGNVFCYLTARDKDTGGHPAPFPKQLALDMIRSWSDENDLVLDPFMGSGTTAVAASELKRNYLGFELNEEYFEISQKRLGCVSVVDSIKLF